MVYRRWRIELAGKLQGVGFRPTVWHLANSLGLSGSVRNQAQGLVIEIQGALAELNRFKSSLHLQRPELSCIDSMRIDEIPIESLADEQEHLFKIEDSQIQSVLLCDAIPDLAPCENCLRELFDPENRRYLYPMISCTTCGPRYSIQQRSPFDRAQTSLSRYPLCQACHQEYTSPSERRFHSQTIGCFQCGPQWVWTDRHGSAVQCDDAAAVLSMLERLEQTLLDGGIVLIKGLGGYQFLCDAASSQAGEGIRWLKHRDSKPFAVLVETLEQALELVELTPTALDVLQSKKRPIVVGRRRNLHESLMHGSWISPLRSSLGVMLPNSPIQYLLARRIDRPVIVTSANTSGEPILIDDREVLDRYRSKVDGILHHERQIVQALDDPVFIDTEVGVIPIRLGRGNAPCRLPMQRQQIASLSGIAMGADLKAAWGISSRDSLYLMEHIGDASNAIAAERIERSIATALASELPISTILTDLHPGYQTTRIGERQSEECAIRLPHLTCRAVQHHAAHLGSLGVDLMLQPDEPFLGFVFDGTGYGSDGTIWGGELIGIVGSEYSRLGYLRPLRVPMGDVAAKYPWRVALALVADAQVSMSTLENACDWVRYSPWVGLTESQQCALMVSMSDPSLSTATSSVGRFLDGLASLLGFVHTNQYEGHAAMILEDMATVYYRGRLADQSTESELVLDAQAYRFTIGSESSALIFDARSVVRSVIEDLANGIHPSRIAYRIHASIAMMIAQTLPRLADPWRGVRRIGFTGGVFQNRLLTDLGSHFVGRLGLRACVHRQVPPNDSGLAVGQLWFGIPG